MANPFHHAESSARKFGGKPEDYQAIHDWFDATKESYADMRHRALRHHSQGIFEAERQFGHTITNSSGRQVPVRLIGEQHVREDCGRIPSVQDWLQHLTVQPWMARGYPLEGSKRDEGRFMLVWGSRFKDTSLEDGQQGDERFNSYDLAEHSANILRSSNSDLWVHVKDTEEEKP